MTTYIGQPADQYWFTSPLLGCCSRRVWGEEGAVCRRCVRLGLRRGRPEGQGGGARTGAMILVFIIFARIICSGRSLCPASALPFFSKPCRHLRMGFTSAPPSCLISSCYMNTPAKKLHYEAPSLECFKLSSPPLDLCIQFSGEADFEDFEEGEAL